MSEEGMEHAVQEALAREGIAEEVLAAGTIGGMRANAAAHGMPQWMLVGVTADRVYGFDGRSRVNVRVLELIHPESGSRIELEGSRVPLTHSKDVIEALTG
jgi:hypothetical protein